jgi:hypothetical protein
MEPSQPTAQETSPRPLCGVCHIPLLPEYYFCPNCGKQIHEPPLPTGIGTQLGLYFFSILLPFICFLFVGRWKGIKYMRSEDTKAKLIGTVALLLLIGSTLFSFWYAYHVITTMVQSAMGGATSGSLDELQKSLQTIQGAR